MASRDRDLRAWMALLEKEGELKRIKAEVDWDDEISQIIRKVYEQNGPALLFENIKDHKNTFCTKLFTNGLGKQSRVNLMLNLPKQTTISEAIKIMRSRIKSPVKARMVKTGPAKENKITGRNIDLFQIPVPKWHPLDGGRYINTYYGAVTKDPDTGINNVGIYRGMIISKNKISVLLMPVKDWGITYEKYKTMGKPMPVAFVYGFEPALLPVAGTPVVGQEYEIAGALRQQPMELVKCETCDIDVPAHAELVLEGTMSPDPKDYAVEGPFGEGSGYYGEARKRPVVEIKCITYRNDPIFRGALVGTAHNTPNELGVLMSNMMAAVLWNHLDAAEIPGILDLATGPLTAIKIHKTYQGQPRQIAAALWGSKFAGHPNNITIVTEEDVDIRNPMALWGALHAKTDFTKGLVVYPLYMGSPIDVCVEYSLRNELEYGASVRDKLLIDATIDWEKHPIRPEWGDQRYPPTCHYSSPKTVKLVQRRWKDYGL